MTTTPRSAVMPSEMPLCECGHRWAYHVKDLDNIDVDPRAYCTETDCRCADYTPPGALEESSE